MGIFDRFPAESDEVWRTRLDDMILVGTNWIDEFHLADTREHGLGALGLEGVKRDILAERAAFNAEFGPEFDS
jgi:hypothetical protein